MRVAIPVAVVVLLLSGCVVPSSQLDTAVAARDSLKAQLDVANATRDSLQTDLYASQVAEESAKTDYKVVKGEYDQLKADDESAKAQLETTQRDLRKAQADLTSSVATVALLRDRVGDLSSQLTEAAAPRDGTTLAGGNASFHFHLLDGTAQTWTWPVDAYKTTILRNHPYSQLRLQTPSGAVIATGDMRPYLRADDFTTVISPLTSGRSAQDFIREVVNLKKSFVVYGNSIADASGGYKFPMETIMDGSGICGDTTILLASLIVAGNKVASYGMTIKLWYGKMNPDGEIVSNAETLNHAWVGITFRDGSGWALETTTSQLTVHNSSWGWSFDAA